MSGSDRWFCDSTPGEKYPAWTRGNAADVFPDPFSPLGKDYILRRAMSLGLRDAYIRMGALDWEEFENPEAPDLFQMYGGYPYNPLSLTRLLGARMPGASPEAIDKAFFDERDEVPQYVEEAWHVSPKHEAALGATMGWVMSTDSLPFLDADKERAEFLRDTRPDLAALEDGALIARAKSMLPHVQQMFESAMVVSSMASMGPGALSAICEAVGKPELSIGLLAGIDVDSSAPSHAMWALSRTARASAEITAAFDAGVDGLVERLEASASDGAKAYAAGLRDFIRTYGSRGPNEYDILAASWEVKPRVAFAAIDLMRKSEDSQAPAVRHAASVAEKERAAAVIRELVAGDAETAGMFEAALKSAGLFLSGRERAKTNAIMVIGEVRMAVRELGRRFVERGLIPTVEHVFMLTGDELEHFRHDPEPMKDTIVQRWEQFRSLFEYEPVFVVNGRVPGLSEMTRRTEKGLAKATSGTVLKGAAGSGGTATGRARVVLDPGDPEGLEPGDVLVAPQTDPSWVPLFVPAAAVIVNVGAMGSHAMIVSRELGIPCVASVADATHLIPDGAMVTVDGATGTVTVH
ncbi:MAG: PEP-utilizing enzyme [Ilumatobacteraceae bacterium]